MKKFIIVNRDLHEIYLNQFDGTLPPMTEQEIKEYFNDGSLLSIAQKHNLTFYEADDKHLCPHCHTPLTKSETKVYKWQCFYCDEDFGSFENNTEKAKEFYQITETDDTLDARPLIIFGSAKAIIDFVNERNEGADKKIDNMEDAKQWLFDNGYELEKRRNLIERLNKDEQIYIQ